MKDLGCYLGRHTGQKEGGTMMYTCPGCGESFWQEKDMSYIASWGDQMLDAGKDPDEVLEAIQEQIRRIA